MKEDFEALSQKPEPLLRALSPWLITRRWSGLSGVKIKRVDVLDYVRIASDELTTIFATLIRIVPDSMLQRSRIFYVPIQLKFQETENGWLPVRYTGGVAQIREAEYSSEYNNFLLHQVVESQSIHLCKGILLFKSLDTISERLVAKNVTTLGKGDTTNIVVKVETGRKQALVMKTYKNVTEDNPEPEMLSVLTESGFNNAPTMVGEMIYTSPRKRMILTIIQRFEESEDDGRQPFAKSLQKELNGSRKDETSDSKRLASRLGAIIAAMHHALGHSRKRGFGASLITEKDLEQLNARIEKLFTDLLWEASQREEEFDPTVSQLLTATSMNRESIRKGLAPFKKMLGMMKIRTHQDLHLAQLLTSNNGETDFQIIDFEGDPQRTGKARRQKECPLRDLGTVARSFSYLRYNVLDQLLEKAGFHESNKNIASYDLEPQINLKVRSVRSFDSSISTSKEWETKIRKAMIQGYLTEVERFGDKFLSKKGKVEFDVVDTIVKSWEIEKALLEARYELHHRPQNLIIPLAGLLTLCY